MPELGPTEADRHRVAPRPEYSWDQSFDEVNIYVRVPTVTSTTSSDKTIKLSNMIEVTLTPTTLRMAPSQTQTQTGHDTVWLAKTIEALRDAYTMIGALSNPIKSCESTWTVEVEEATGEGGQFKLLLLKLTITLQKQTPGHTWNSVFAEESSGVSILSVEEDKKRILKERFQRQFGSQFNFDGAQINGSDIPDASTYLNDLKN